MHHWRCCCCSSENGITLLANLVQEGMEDAMNKVNEKITQGTPEAGGSLTCIYSTNLHQKSALFQALRWAELISWDFLTMRLDFA